MFSYLVVYDPASSPLEIMAVIHSARDVARLLTEDRSYCSDDPTFEKSGQRAGAPGRRQSAADAASEVGRRQALAGAVALGLSRERAILNDINPYLISFYGRLRRRLTITIPLETIATTRAG